MGRIQACHGISWEGRQAGDMVASVDSVSVTERAAQGTEIADATARIKESVYLSGRNVGLARDGTLVIDGKPVAEVSELRVKARDELPTSISVEHDATSSPSITSTGDLPQVVEAVTVTVATASRSQVRHAAVGIEECVRGSLRVDENPGHLTKIVDCVPAAARAAQSAKICHGVPDSADRGCGAHQECRPGQGDPPSMDSSSHRLSPPRHIQKSLCWRSMTEQSHVVNMACSSQKTM